MNKEIEKLFVALEAEKAKIVRELERVVQVQEILKNLDESVLVDLGGGIFAKAKIEDLENFLVLLPGNCAVERDKNKILKELEETKERLFKAIDRIEAQKQALVNKKGL